MAVIASDTIAAGIPNVPSLVTVVPFSQIANPTPEEATKVLIAAEIDGHRGNFILDLGMPLLYLNRTFFQPSPSGGIDTVTPTHRIPEPDGDDHEDTVHVGVVRIGTLGTNVVEPMIPAPNPRHLNAFLNHEFGNYANCAPRLGNIGLSVLEPFETIIDYTHRRVVLIRLDAAGRRLVDVPAYRPTWSAPLVDWVYPPAAGPRYAGARLWGVLGTVDSVTDTLSFDTGAPSSGVSPRLGARLVDGVLDHLTIAGREFGTIQAFSADIGYDLNILGYPFLHQRGAIGFNHRAHQVMLYEAQLSPEHSS